MQGLCLKYVQCNSEGLHLLPSKYGLSVVRDRLSSAKIEYEEVEIAFADRKVRAIKIKVFGAPKYLQRETRFYSSDIPNVDEFYLFTTTGHRVRFKLPVFIEVPDENATK